MTGEKNLDKLLKSMSPELMNGEYVFCTFQNARYGDYSDLEPIASFIESEGLTLVIPKSKADEKNVDYDSVFKGITLSVHSSLDAVGLTAAFSNKLAEHGISANVIAGYYHDHIFIQSEFAARALEALDEFAC
ncbi:ACT domain-containing protein [Marinobacter sp.]|uniref:ACT domain-containing protein n=1 Tax=Marinobacter sp. TaxID=50741 RepID=UPI002B278313|nr:ACT domain-containing protein [Marinobacter sp.]